jgi:hypothetical protein
MQSGLVSSVIHRFEFFGGEVALIDNLGDRSTMQAFEIIKEHTAANTYRAEQGNLLYWRAWLIAISFKFDRYVTEREVPW